MGIYKQLGIRNIAIYISDLITWTRNYGLKDGRAIQRGLARKKKSFFKLELSMFKNTVWLRDNYSDPAIFRQVFYDKQYDFSSLPFVIPTTRIIDAGANIGFASLYFANIFPNAEIVAIEPEPENFALLQKNTSGYPNIYCEQAALWHKNEMVTIANPDSLAASFMVEKTEENAITGITIDSILEKKNWNDVDIVKMDIEGAEKEIFSSNADWLLKVKVLIIELHDRYKADCTKTFFKALEAVRYEAYFQHENIFILIN